MDRNRDTQRAGTWEAGPWVPGQITLGFFFSMSPYGILNGSSQTFHKSLL